MVLEVKKLRPLFFAMQHMLLTEGFECVCETFKPLSTQLEGRRLFLTGGTGFFGKWFIHSFIRMRQLSSSDATLTVLSRDPKQFLALYPELLSQKGIDFIAGEIRSFTPPENRSFDLMIHGATPADVKLEKEDPAEMFSVIVDGTKRMLEFASQAGTTRFMMISSGAVYGVQPPDVPNVSETYAGAPVAAYGKGKLQAEQMCVEAGDRHGFAALLPRCFAFVGPYLPLDTHFAIGNFIRDVLDEAPIVIKGDGTPLRSYLYAADLAEWLWTILLKGEHARAYNVGSDEATSILDLANKVQVCAGTSVPIMVRGTPDPSVPPPRYVPSIERAKSELGLTIRCPLEDAINLTLAWHRAGKATSG